MTILVYLEHAGDKLPKTSLSTLRAALEMKKVQGYSKVVALLVGSSPETAAAEAAQFGPDEVITVSAPELDSYLAPVFADAVTAVAEKIGATTVVRRTQNDERRT